jgi:hypothetical protein
MSWVREYGLWLAEWRFPYDNQGHAGRETMKSNAVFLIWSDADHSGCSRCGHLQDILLDDITFSVGPTIYFAFKFYYLTMCARKISRERRQLKEHLSTTQ